MLALALPECNIGLAARPFIAVSLSLSQSAPRLHRAGPLTSAVRAGLTPPGLLPPTIAQEGDILVSGENEVHAVAGAAAKLSPCPVVFLYPSVPGLGALNMSYRQIAGPFLRLTSFQGPSTPEKRLRLETVLGGASARMRSSPPAACQSFGIPIPQGVSPMDWSEWATLRDGAFAWTCAEVEARGLAQS